MRPIALSALLLTGLTLTACATGGGLKFDAEAGTYAQRGAAAQIQVFDAEPGGRAFIRVGRISWDYTSGTVEVRLVDLLPQLKQKAWEVGGDAFVVRQAGYVGTPSAGKAFVVRADVIRWQP